MRKPDKKIKDISLKILNLILKMSDIKLKNLLLIILLLQKQYLQK
jgi:hypothetical protein